LLSSLAHTLLEAIRRLALRGTELARANTRRIRFLLSSACPYQRLFYHAVAKLVHVSFPVK